MGEEENTRLERRRRRFACVVLGGPRVHPPKKEHVLIERGEGGGDCGGMAFLRYPTSALNGAGQTA